MYYDALWRITSFFDARILIRCMATYYEVLRRTMTYCVVLKYYAVSRRITTYCDVLRCTRFCSVLPGRLRRITMYYDVLRRTSTYYDVPRRITTFYDVVRRITTMRCVQRLLLPPPFSSLLPPLFAPGRHVYVYIYIYIKTNITTHFTTRSVGKQTRKKK